jgi:hypothetical protein
MRIGLVADARMHSPSTSYHAQKKQAATNFEAVE